MNKQMAQNHKKGKNKGQINRKNKVVRLKTAEEIDQVYSLVLNVFKFKKLSKF